MDTTEELNGTYFYAGRANLTASELLFMIFCEQFAEQPGVDDYGAIVSGLNISSTRQKPRDAIKGTSLASRASRKVFVGRGMPVVGWAILARYVSAISYRTTVRYNVVARGSGKRHIQTVLTFR